jgi:hypothetical protein
LSYLNYANYKVFDIPDVPLVIAVRIQRCMPTMDSETISLIREQFC